MPVFLNLIGLYPGGMMHSFIRSGAVGESLNIVIQWTESGRSSRFQIQFSVK